MIGVFLTFAVSIFLALLPGCATPTTYGDGAPMRAPVAEPRPGYAPVGTGLPEYWGSPEPEALPRSPHKRVLPPQAGPGIWAGDEPRASDEQPDNSAYFLDVMLPWPEPNPSEHERRTAWECAKGLNISAFKIVPGGSIESLLGLFEKWPQRQRECLAGGLYLMCLETAKASYGASKAAGEILSPLIEASLARSIAAARALVARSCAGPLPADMRAFDAAIREDFSKGASQWKRP